MLAKLLVLIFVSGLTKFATSNYDARIINGQIAEPGQFPFLAGLYVNFDKKSGSNVKGEEFIVPSIWCSAAIIEPNWAIIPAHCVAGLDTSMYMLLVGTNVLFSGGAFYNVSLVVVHPNYNFNDGLHLNDIALLQVPDDFTLTANVSTIGIGDVSPDQACTIMGWGQLENSTYPNELYFTQMATIDDQTCQDLAESAPNPIHLGNDEICAISPDGTGAPCNGDAGPIVFEEKIVALTSYAVGPCQPKFPAVCTKLTFHEKWIQSVIRP